MNIDTDRISRVALINESGLVFERYGVYVDLQLQDDEHTLKLFIKDRPIGEEWQLINEASSEIKRQAKEAVDRLIDPDCRAGKHDVCAGDPCMCSCHYDGRDADQ